METNQDQDTGTQVTIRRERDSDASDVSSGNHLVVTGLYDVEAQERKSSISFDKIKQISLTYSLQSEDDEKQMAASEDNPQSNSFEVSKSNLTSNANSLVQPNLRTQDEAQEADYSGAREQGISMGQLPRRSSDRIPVIGQNQRSLRGAHLEPRVRGKSSRAHGLLDDYYTSGLDIGEGEDEDVPREDEEGVDDEISVVLEGDIESHQSYRTAFPKGVRTHADRDANNITGVRHRRSPTNTGIGQMQPGTKSARNFRQASSPVVYCSAPDYYDGDDGYEDIHQGYNYPRVTRARIKYDQEGNLHQLKNSAQKLWLLDSSVSRAGLPNRRPLTESQQFSAPQTSSQAFLGDSPRVRPILTEQRLVRMGGGPIASGYVPLVYDDLLRENRGGFVDLEDELGPSYTPDKLLHTYAYRPSGSLRTEPKHEIECLKSGLGGLSSATSLTSNQLRNAGSLIRRERGIVAGNGRLYNTGATSQPTTTARSDVAHLFRSDDSREMWVNEDNCQGDLSSDYVREEYVDNRNPRQGRSDPRAAYDALQSKRFGARENLSRYSNVEHDLIINTDESHLASELGEFGHSNRTSIYATPLRLPKRKKRTGSNSAGTFDQRDERINIVISSPNRYQRSGMKATHHPRARPSWNDYSSYNDYRSTDSLSRRAFRNQQEISHLGEQPLRSRPDYPEHENDFECDSSVSSIDSHSCFSIQGNNHIRDDRTLYRSIDQGSNFHRQSNEIDNLSVHPALGNNKKSANFRGKPPQIQNDRSMYKVNQNMVISSDASTTAFQKQPRDGSVYTGHKYDIISNKGESAKDSSRKVGENFDSPKVSVNQRTTGEVCESSTAVQGKPEVELEHETQSSEGLKVGNTTSNTGQQCSLQAQK